MQSAFHNIKVRQGLMLALILALFLLIFWNLRFYLPAFLGAYTLYVLLRRPMLYLHSHRKWNNRLSAALLMLASFIVIMIPLNGIVFLLNSRVKATFNNSQQIIDNVTAIIQKTETKYGIALLTTDNIKSINDWLMFSVGDVVNATVNSVLIILMMYFILWFMLTANQRMEQTFFKWLPLKEHSVKYVRTQLHELVYTNALGIPLMGVVQGLVALPLYWLVGVEDYWFWTLLTAIAGMIPLFGVMLAYIPLTIILFSNNMATQAIIVLVYGFVIIGSVDNIARMWVLNKIGNAHPMITFFGVIIGLKLFGFVGFVFGPILISMFLVLLRLYEREFKQSDEAAEHE